MLWLTKKWRRLWLRVRNRFWGTPIPFETICVPELPEEIQAGRLYLVGENGFLWIAALICPCGCQSVIQLNLLPEAKPCWRVEEHADGTASLAPSVWSRQGCGSHYFVRRGFIKWHIEN